MPSNLYGVKLLRSENESKNKTTLFFLTVVVVVVYLCPAKTADGNGEEFWTHIAHQILGKSEKRNEHKY